MDIYVDGRKLELGKRIGKGGEGEVFLANNQNKEAVKIYLSKLASSREGKVVAMVEERLWEKTNLITFPKSIIRSKRGDFLGFTMNIVDGHKPIHELYGVKSRKNLYPKADFRFLIRAATNVARAVGQVHQSPCVIGDLNHSGILVSETATVSIIDADSFQFERNNHRFPCLVGVPDFTPPELHGMSLNGVPRSKQHDYFGLGVAIFQLLFLGRHPYAGRYSGADLTLEQMIAKNLFAYSIKRNTNTSPPNAMLTLQDLSTDVAELFERCFGLSAANRPNPTEWINALTKMETSLVRCNVNNVHYFPSQAKACPWCKIENLTGAILFIGYLDSNTSLNDHGKIDIERLWNEIEQTVLPKISDIVPHLGHINKPLPTEAAKDAKRLFAKKWKYFIFACIIGAWIALPNLTIIWIILLVACWFYSSSDGTHLNEWQDKYRIAAEEYDKALLNWSSRLGITKLNDLKKALEISSKEYKALSYNKSSALQKLQTDRRSRQLEEFLDRYQIRTASISGIGAAKTTTLASWGVETAADISYSAIIRIPGFGDATARKLLSWRQGYERHFVYNPTPTSADSYAKNKVEADFAAKSKELTNKILSGKQEFEQILKATKARLATGAPEITALYQERLQIECDLEFLGIPKPNTYSGATSTQSPSNTSTRPPPSSYGSSTTSNVPNCPKCGSYMVHRVTWRGRSRGSTFWGCSRFPKCRGTR